VSAARKPRLAKTPVVEVDEEPSWCFQSITNVKAERTKWFMKGRIADGSLVVIDGPKGSGKSTLCAVLAAHVTAGLKLPGSSKRPAGDVLWLTSEESYKKAVKPRLAACGCDMARVHVPEIDNMGNWLHFSFPSKGKVIKDFIERMGVQLLVLDPLISHLDTGVLINNEDSVRPVLEGIGRIAQATGCVIAGIRHIKKDTSCSRLNQGLGGVAISNVARTVLSIDQPDHRSARRVLRVAGTNMAARPGPLEYEIVGKGDSAIIEKWKEIALADDDPEADQMEPGERSVRGDAKKLLRALLAKEWVPCKQVIAEAEGAGISLRTLNTAKAELLIQRRRVGSATPAYWEWGPPKGGWN